jgi:hypothetical protein
VIISVVTAALAADAAQRSGDLRAGQGGPGRRRGRDAEDLECIRTGQVIERGQSSGAGLAQR